MSSRQENHYEELETQEGPVEERSLPTRHSVVRERTSQDTAQLVYEPVNYATTFFGSLSLMRDRNQLCDVSIIADHIAISAHKAVLAAFSPYFHAMFSGDLKESSSDSVSIKGFVPTAIKSLIDYCYTGRLVINLDNVEDILPVAGLLQMTGITDACCNFLVSQLHPSNCLGIRRFADIHSCFTLWKKCNVFMEQRFPEVALHEEFMEIDYKELVDIISDSHLNIRGEEQIYEATIAWIKHNLEERKQYIGNTLKCIRMPLMSASYLSREVKNEPLVMDSFIGRGYLIDAMDYHLQKHYRRDLPSTNNVMTTPRHCPGLNYLFAIGGSGPPVLDNPYLDLCECFDTEKNEWKSVAPLTHRRCGIRVAQCGGYLYAIGGYSDTNSKALSLVERYDPMTDSWRAMAPIKCPRRAFAVAVLNGSIYVIGGINGGSYYGSVERYSIKKNQWRFVQPMSIERRAVTATVLDNYIFVAGGYDGESLLDSVERYDPASDIWTVYTKLTSPRCLGAFVTLKGHLYAVGGFDRFDGSSALKTLQRYCPETEEWESLAPLSASRSGFGAAVMDGMLYLVGGCKDFTKVSTTDKYDPDKDEWTNIADMTVRRSGVAVGVAPAILF